MYFPSIAVTLNLVLPSLQSVAELGEGGGADGLCQWVKLWPARISPCLLLNTSLGHGLKLDSSSRGRRALTHRGNFLTFKTRCYQLLDSSCVSKSGFDLKETFDSGCICSTRGSVTRCKLEPRGAAPERAMPCGLTSVAEGSNNRVGSGEEDRRTQICSAREKTWEEAISSSLRTCCHCLFSWLRH